MDPVGARVAVIVDLVESREAPDRRSLQRRFDDALRHASSRVAAQQSLHPTVGDEAQGRFGSVVEAIRALALVRLAPGAPLDCRAGIGVGEMFEVGHNGCHVIEDGPGWWAARDAIILAKQRQRAQWSVRTCVLTSVGGDAGSGAWTSGLNARLADVDEAILALSESERVAVREQLTSSERLSGSIGATEAVQRFLLAFDDLLDFAAQG